jgi:TonB-dependent heme/hemoglobin receptor
VIGGVVTFRTLDFADVALPEKDYGVRLNATGGTNAFDFNGSLAAAAKVSENFDFVAAVGRKKLGEYEIGKRGEVAGGPPGEKAEFTTQDQWSWLGKATATFDDHKLTLSYTGLSAKFGTGSGQYIDTNDVTNHTAVADWRWTPGNWWADLNAKLYYTRTQDEQFRPARTPPGPQGFKVDYKIDTFGGSVSNTSRFSASVFDVALTYGAEYFIDKAKTKSVGENPADDPDGTWFGSNPVGDRGVGGAFARAEVKHGDWLQVLAGVRYDRYDLDGKGSVYDAPLGGCVKPSGGACPRGFKVDESGGRVSPTATIAVTPMQGVQLYASYEQGFRPPTIMESVLGGTHIGGGINFAPNPDLKPEVSRTYEAGLNLKFDGVLREDDAFRAKASVYHTDVDNFITQALYYPTAIRYFYRYVNLETKTKLRGVDLEANYDAGFAYVGGSASLIDADYGEDYDAGPNAPFSGLLGLYLAPKAKFVLDGGVRFLDRRLTLGGRVTHVTPEDIISTQVGLYEVEKYTLIDLYAHLKVNDNVTFRAAVENVRDVAYVDAMGSRVSPSPGRTFTLGATVRF